MLLYTSHDDQSAWLAAGQALSALWIHATQGGMSITPDTQVIEVPRIREQLRHHLLDDLGHPQVLLHVGWQEATRRPAAGNPEARTRRRPAALNVRRAPRSHAFGGGRRTPLLPTGQGPSPCVTGDHWLCP